MASLESQVSFEKDSKKTLESDVKTLEKKNQDSEKSVKSLQDHIENLKAENVRLSDRMESLLEESVSSALNEERKLFKKRENELLKEIESLKTASVSQPVTTPASVSGFKSTSLANKEYELKLAFEARDEMSAALMEANKELEQL